MPPKARITRDMIVEAAFEIVREQGVESVNARTVANRLECSTQPIMYHFDTMEELKRAVYQKADEYHSEYITNIHSDNPLKDIGLNYIRFAVEEKSLFRFLFQSNEFSGSSFLELTNSQQIQPVIELLGHEAGVSLEDAGTVFNSVFLIAHGYASMFANNEITYNEEQVCDSLDLVLDGMILALKEK